MISSKHTLLAVLAVSAASCGGRGTESSAVMTAEFSDFDSGEALTLGDFDGMPLVVNLWSSWCPSCIHEMPDFEAVSHEYAGRVEFIGIGVDDDPDAARELLEETGVTYQIGNDDSGVFSVLLETVAMPSTAFITADGDVVEVHGGQLSADALRDLIDAHLIEGRSGDVATGVVEVTPADANADDTFDPAYLDEEGGSFPAVDDPVLVAASDADWMKPDDIVMGIVADSGEAQAFPVDQMAFHHVANTRLAGEPFVVTY